MTLLLKYLGFIALGLLGLVFICFLLYILAVTIVVACRTIKEEVRKHDRTEQSRR